MTASIATPSTAGKTWKGDGEDAGNVKLGDLPACLDIWTNRKAGLTQTGDRAEDRITAERGKVPMRTIELSNHPAKRHQAVLDEQAAAAAQVQAEYEAQLADHAEHLRHLQGERDEARHARRWLRWLGRGLAVWLAGLEKPRPPHMPAGTSGEEAKLTAGMEGEQLVADHLAAVLGEEWGLLRGYRNRGGEIDDILVGPQGVIAIEVKHRNATVGCSGDEWWFDKYDRWGNHVEQGWLADRAGRSPSRQLNEPADALEGFLATRGKRVTIRRVVLLTHGRSRLGETSEVAVDLISTTTSDVLAYLIDDQPPILSDADRNEIERLIIRDHKLHETKRPRRRPNNNRPTGKHHSRAARSGWR